MAKPKIGKKYKGIGVSGLYKDTEIVGTLEIGAFDKYVIRNANNIVVVIDPKTLKKTR